MSGSRVRKVATDAIFKKWGFKNPMGVLRDCNINSISYKSQGTFRPQHQRLMSKVDDLIKK